MNTLVDLEELKALMKRLGMSTGDAEEYRVLLEGNLRTAAMLDALSPPAAAPLQREWSRPTEAENPLGAWYVRTHIQTREEGRLAGKTVAVKDNVLLAGVPLMNGTRVLEGYVPDVDAEIVRRLLDAGATITGKTVCEAYCFSGGSHTAATGPVRNPLKPTHSAGGSSSGSGVVVANGEADMAIGCDQGGSIRMPSSFCGIVGLKPTYSLVPYTGVLGMNPNVDHTGPMTRNVAENALMLEVLAGNDGADSRQRSVVTGNYSQALGQDVRGLRIGIVTEGFDTPVSETAVSEAVRRAAEAFAELGVELREISVPEHALSGALTFGAMQALVTSIFDMDGFVLERPDLVPVEFVRRQRRWREHADELPPNLKAVLLESNWMREHHGFEFAARAMHNVPRVRSAYDRALQGVDALLMPTTPMKATRLPSADVSISEWIGLAFAPVYNTMPFNHTHHPAISIPCAMVDGLPAGMMLVGRHFDECTLYRLASAFEQAGDWRKS